MQFATRRASCQNNPQAAGLRRRQGATPQSQDFILIDIGQDRENPGC
jgi:hypothetical protein